MHAFLDVSGIRVRRQDQHTNESRASDIKGAFALTVSTAKTISQNRNLIGRVTKNNKRAERTALVSFSAVFLDFTQPFCGGGGGGKGGA